MALGVSSWMPQARAVARVSASIGWALISAALGAPAAESKAAQVAAEVSGHAVVTAESVEF